jgi:hypothetical protein
LDDLREADGVIFGSPTRYGNMIRADEILSLADVGVRLCTVDEKRHFARI